MKYALAVLRGRMQVPQLYNNKLHDIFNLYVLPNIIESKYKFESSLV